MIRRYGGNVQFFGHDGLDTEQQMCAGGGCTQTCAKGADCQLLCAGGKCKQDCGKDAKECVQECVSEFISFVASEVRSANGSIEYSAPPPKTRCSPPTRWSTYLDVVVNGGPVEGGKGSVSGTVEQPSTGAVGASTPSADPEPLQPGTDSDVSASVERCRKVRRLTILLRVSWDGGTRRAPPIVCMEFKHELSNMWDGDNGILLL